MLATPRPGGRRGDEGARGVRPRPRAGGDRVVLLDVLRRLPRARQGARIRPGPTSARRPLRSPCASRCRRCCACSPRCSSFATEEAWSWFNDDSVHTASWPEPHRRRRRPGRAHAQCRGPHRHPSGQDRGQSVAEDPGHSATIAHPPRPSPSRARRGRPARGRSDRELTYSAGGTSWSRASSSHRRSPDMQFGTRWTSGDQPPAAVPEALRRPASRRRAVLTVDQLGQPAPRWTLTWLEGRPIAELDTGVIVTLDATGEPVVRHDEDGFGLVDAAATSRRGAASPRHRGSIPITPRAWAASRAAANATVLDARVDALPFHAVRRDRPRSRRRRMPRRAGSRTASRPGGAGCGDGGHDCPPNSGSGNTSARMVTGRTSSPV